MKIIFFSFLVTIFLFSCKKQLSDFHSEPLSSYYPLVVGKYITYDLDSTIFINFGQNMSTVHYQAQDRVDAQITDNLGRTGFRIIRYIRSLPDQDWTPNNTFLVTPTDNTIEYTEDNMKYQKLKVPFTNGYTWKGNSFIDTYSLNSEVKFLDDWDYTYDSVNVPLKFGNLTFDSTLKVAQRDEMLGQDPSLPGTQFAEKNYSIEKYAKNIGLIYKEFLHWEFQGGQPGRPSYFVGYGIKLSVTGYN